MQTLKLKSEAVCTSKDNMSCLQKEELTFPSKKKNVIVSKLFEIIQIKKTVYIQQ